MPITPFIGVRISWPHIGEEFALRPARGLADSLAWRSRSAVAASRSGSRKAGRRPHPPRPGRAPAPSSQPGRRSKPRTRPRRIVPVQGWLRTP